MQALMTIFQCSRRHQKLSAPRKKRGAKLQETRDLAWKSSEGEEPSTDAVSDHSEPSSLWDASSDTTAGSSEIHSNVSFSPPPGLDLPPASAMFPPLAASTAHWLRDISEGRMEQPQPQEDSKLAELKQALDRLAPAEIATVKALLDSKMRDAGVVTSSATAMATQRSGHNSAPWNHPERRCFAPIQGSCPKSRMPRATHNALHKVEDQSESLRKKIQDAEQGPTLRTFLEDLSLIDASRVVMVRKINRLGVDSPEILQSYFEKFGAVDRMMVSHSIAKTRAGTGPSNTRLRPAVLGFVVMKNAAEAEAARNLGETQTVGGKEIIVGKFESHSIDGTN